MQQWVFREGKLVGVFDPDKSDLLGTLNDVAMGMGIYPTHWLYRTADGSFVLESWVEPSQLLTRHEATVWLLENHMPLPDDIRAELGLVDFSATGKGGSRLKGLSLRIFQFMENRTWATESEFVNHVWGLDGATPNALKGALHRYNSSPDAPFQLRQESGNIHKEVPAELRKKLHHSVTES